LTASNTAALASKAPQLQDCSFAVAPGADLAPLGQLPALRSLSVQIDSSSEIRSMTALTPAAALTQLWLNSFKALHADDLLALTVLK
jgi:hypothetical protein